MSEYKNFIQDFPVRCGEILKDYEKQLRFKGRDVTLMLSIASAGLTIPYERIRSCHPSGDRNRYSEAAKKIEKLLAQDFLVSDLSKESSGSWHYGRLQSHEGQPDNWPEMTALIPLAKREKAKQVLRHIRNSLAHGNIYTMGSNINTIIFLSETDYNSGIFKYLTVSPDDFCKFLRNWFAFITNLNLPQEASAGLVADNLEYIQEVVND